jgi:hypothetical protein
MKKQIKIKNTKKISLKEKIAEEKIKAKMFLAKTVAALTITVSNVIIPSAAIMLALNLLGFAISIMTMLSSIALYFILEELKSFIKEVNKK